MRHRGAEHRGGVVGRGFGGSGVDAALAGQVDVVDPIAATDVAGTIRSAVAAESADWIRRSRARPRPPVRRRWRPAGPVRCPSHRPSAEAATAADASASAGAVASPVSVGGGTVFDAGNIVSDAVFYDAASMTDEQIEAFLAAQGAGCTGEWCVKNLRVDVAAQPADEFCAAVPGGVGLSAAAVIGAVSRACGVNPQVMLVTLEKESGLLDRSAVSASSYDAAWGWHCPDTGPGGTANCDPAYAGFCQSGLRDGQAVVALPGASGAVPVPGRRDGQHSVECGRSRAAAERR